MPSSDSVFSAGRSALQNGEFFSMLLLEICQDHRICFPFCRRSRRHTWISHAAAENRPCWDGLQLMPFRLNTHGVDCTQKKASAAVAISRLHADFLHVDGDSSVS